MNKERLEMFKDDGIFKNIKLLYAALMECQAERDRYKDLLLSEDKSDELIGRYFPQFQKYDSECEQIELKILGISE